MAVDRLEVDVERGKAQQRTYVERLTKAVNLLLQCRGLMAERGVVVPAALDRETFKWLQEEAADREAST